MHPLDVDEPYAGVVVAGAADWARAGGARPPRAHRPGGGEHHDGQHRLDITRMIPSSFS